MITERGFGSVARLIDGDVLEGLAAIADGTVDCCVTSPPYWGLRDYGTGDWDGGDPKCGHRLRVDPRVESSKLEGGKCGQGHQHEGFRTVCGHCGARRIDRQIGIEETPDEYVARLVVVFREVRRTLRDDGTLWLNLGDSYAGQSPGSFRPGSGRADGEVDERGQRNRNGNGCPPGLKPKDLVGIPWLTAFALRADGWYLRADNIWWKPNPMPESVQDRTTKAHEHVFLLAKQDRYFYDSEAIREPSDRPDLMQATRTFGAPEQEGTKRRDVGRSGVEYCNPNGRNARSVWKIPTDPYAGAHFATMPRDLAARCVKAGSRIGGLVLDPFMGSGTTLEIALGLGRRGVGIDLNAEYVALARERIGGSVGLLASAEEA